MQQRIVVRVVLMVSLLALGTGCSEVDEVLGSAPVGGGSTIIDLPESNGTAIEGNASPPTYLR